MADDIVRAYVVVQCDRHTDVGIHLFHNPENAKRWARETALDCSRDDKISEPEYGNPEWGWFYRSGLHYWAGYSVEGDCVYVTDATFEDELDG